MPYFLYLGHKGDFWQTDIVSTDFLSFHNLILGRVVRREQSSSIAIELTFAPPQINKRQYQWQYLELARGLLPIVKTIHNRNTGKSPHACSKYSHWHYLLLIEAGQMLIRSRSNYFARDGKRALRFKCFPFSSTRSIITMHNRHSMGHAVWTSVSATCFSAPDCASFGCICRVSKEGETTDYFHSIVLSSECTVTRDLVSCRWGYLPITWDTTLDVIAA